jgi:hypothetical protein
MTGWALPRGMHGAPAAGPPHQPACPRLQRRPELGSAPTPSSPCLQAKGCDHVSSQRMRSHGNAQHSSEQTFAVVARAEICSAQLLGPRGKAQTPSKSAAFNCSSRRVIHKQPREGRGLWGSGGGGRGREGRRQEMAWRGGPPALRTPRPRPSTPPRPPPEGTPPRPLTGGP